jgi:hypothetical protein
MQYLSNSKRLPSQSAYQQWLSRTLNFKQMWGVLLVLAIALSGCVKSDVGIQFQSPNRGEIVQHIEFGDRLQSVSQDSLRTWIRAVERRAAEVGGRVQKVGSQEIAVSIPFTHSDDLEKKFNQFFEAVFNQDQLVQGTSLPTIAAQLTINHSNFLLFERNHLAYTVDLRSLGVLSSSGDVLISPASLFQFQFQLQTPWGARSVSKSTNLRPLALRGGKTLIWSLAPGTQNTLETVFWMPNPIGIGSVVIILLVLLGHFLKYPQLTQTQPTGVRSQ